MDTQGPDRRAPHDAHASGFPTSGISNVTSQRYDLKVSVVVPAMNEEGNIDEFCRLFDEMRRKAPFDAELVFVDDGSSDGTREKIIAAQASYAYLRLGVHHRNRGLTEALQTGFSIATGDVFVFYPADLQYLPEDIPALVAPIAQGADICTGWKQGEYNKKFVSTVYNAFCRWLFDLNVHDLNSVKAFRREVVESIFLRKDWHRYLVVLAANEGYRVVEEKIPLYDRKWGKSKFSIFRIPVGVLDMLAVKFQITFARKPLLYFGFTGALLLLAAFLVGAYAVYERYVQGTGQRQWLYLVILLAFLGLGLFMLGFMSEGQTAMKEELADLRKKTQQILDEVKERESGRSGQ
ncbi:MAG: glycosyltransferase family 2 protein [candidate division Zixibacteria bacterium]|nr:glycosyltransferase family 2 protein [candidate division Zixibacteria bacterium]